MKVEELKELLESLIPTIEDEFRVSDNPADALPDDDVPEMLVTVGWDGGPDWGWQTGDNSFTGGAYPYKNWSLIYLYRDSDCGELADKAIEELDEGNYDYE